MISQKTNEELCSLAQQGNRAALEDLLEANRSFLYHTAYFIYDKNKEFCGSCCVDADDLFQEGAIKLVEKLDLYSSDRGASFLTYAGYVFRNAIADFLTSERTRYKAESRHELTSWSEFENAMESTSYSQYHYPDPQYEYMRNETLTELANAMSSLGERDRRFLEYRFGLKTGNEESPVLTAEHFNLSVNRCRHTERQALKHLRQKMI